MDTTNANSAPARERASATASSGASSRRVRLSELLPDVRELRTLVKEVSDMVDQLLEESKSAQ